MGIMDSVVAWAGNMRLSFSFSSCCRSPSGLPTFWAMATPTATSALLAPRCGAAARRNLWLCM